MIKKDVVIIFIAGITLGILIGFMLGAAYGVKLVINKAVDLMPLFLNISVNEKVVYDALFQYDNNLNSCYNSERGLS